MEKARRRNVPAFGEWNYYYHHYDEAPELPPPPPAGWCAEEAEACSDVWFKYSPPPRRSTPKKVRRPEGRVAPDELKAPPTYVHGGGKGGRLQAGRSRASGDVRSTPAKGGCRVVRPVDADLYQVPPPEFASHRPRRKRVAGSLWMGCLGLNCVA